MWMVLKNFALNTFNDLNSFKIPVMNGSTDGSQMHCNQIGSQLIWNDFDIREKQG